MVMKFTKNHKRKNRYGERREVLASTESPIWLNDGEQYIALCAGDYSLVLHRSAAKSLRNWLNLTIREA